MTIKPFLAHDSARVIEGVRFGKVHVAWFGQQAKVSRRQGYNAHIITHADNPQHRYFQHLVSSVPQMQEVPR